MKEIPLTQGQVALVDDEDYEELTKYSWNADWHDRASTYYARAAGTRLRMHRVIMGASNGQDVDHRNHNGLDNRRSNLRMCTAQQNSHNRRKKSGCSSRYKGVTWVERLGKWKAYVHVSGRKQHYLGLYETDREAALAYDRKAVELFGEFACLNGVEP